MRPRATGRTPPARGSGESPSRAAADKAATLSHDIKQPLAAAANYISAARNVLARQTPPASAVVDEALEKAAAQIVRAAEMAARLRDMFGDADK